MKYDYINQDIARLFGIVPGLLYAEAWKNARYDKWETSLFEMCERYPYVSEGTIWVSLSILLSEELLTIEGVEADSRPHIKDKLILRCRRYS